MNPNASFIRSLRRRLSAAFTLVEIMIAVTLMSVIILGLMAMFTQTQRAFRMGMNQTDVLEAGRIAMDMMTREIEQTTPSGKPVLFKGSGDPWNTPGFYAELRNASNTGQQLLPGGDYRTNYMSDLFFVVRENQMWKGIGYFVRTNGAVENSFGPVGTLYRSEFEATDSNQNVNHTNLFSAFDIARSGTTNGISKIIDGVIHFSVKAYDQNGELIAPPRFGPNVWTNVVFADYPPPGIPSGVTRYVFFSNTVPASVELEIGVFEQQTYERYKAIPVLARKQEYYTNHAGNVHIFRQRIPVRRFDASAFQ